MQYRQDVMQSKLITISTVTIRNFGTNPAADFCLHFGKFLPQICDLAALPTNVTMKRLVRCKVHLVIQQTAETVPKSIHNWRRYPSSKCHEIDENVQL